MRNRRVGNGAAVLDTNNLVSRAFSLENVGGGGGGRVSSENEVGI